MRSLSVESIPANKNMKLLSLLVTLLALSYANSDRTSKNFSEIRQRLRRLGEHLEKNQLDAHNVSVDIQIPQDLKNACECKSSFAKHLNHFLRSLKSIVPKNQIHRNQIDNILDNLKHFKDLPNENCKFTDHKTGLTSEDLQKFIKANIEFTQNWTAHCKTVNTAKHQ